MRLTEIILRNIIYCVVILHLFQSTEQILISGSSNCTATSACTSNVDNPFNNIHKLYDDGTCSMSDLPFVSLRTGICSNITYNGEIEGQYFRPRPQTLVDIPGLGRIQGSTQKTYLTQREFPAFTGIPYARVVKRFTPPVEVTRLTTEGSNEVFDATRASVPCMQVPNPIVPGSNNPAEDCLNLNVFTPRVKSVSPVSKPLPVIVFIHGGSFIRWSGNMWDGRRLLERDVVLVTINYRLGALGFLALGTDEIPGNAGMYDMVAALQWVQKHISHFGGDPTRVTIAGQSAGGASVSWLLDSPLAKGLFRNAIAFSGADVDGWAIQPTPIVGALSAAKALNCSFFLTDPILGTPTTLPDNSRIADCLNALPATAFLLPLGTFYAAPAVQQTFILSIPKFAPLNPYVSMATGTQNPVPLIIGTTKNDGSFLVSRLYSSTIAPLGLDKNPEFLKTQLLPSLFASWGLTDNPPGYFDTLASTYLGTAKDSGVWSQMVPGLIDLYGAVFFKMGAEVVANFHASQNQNTFLYSFDYFGQATLYPALGGVPQVPRGAAHTDDIMYVFDLAKFTRAEDYLISFFLVDAWVNFATTSDPNKRSESDDPIYTPWPKWSPLSHEFVKINVIPTESNNYEAYWIGASRNIQG